MDITTVNDRHLYSATVRLRDAEHPGGSVELPGRVVRFGPPGWLTVAGGRDDAEGIALVPTHQVLAVTHLSEAEHPGASITG
jgi:hypothetical protein